MSARLMPYSLQIKLARVLVLAERQARTGATTLGIFQLFDDPEVRSWLSSIDAAELPKLAGSST